jgi:hypothetical protein
MNNYFIIVLSSFNSTLENAAKITVLREIMLIIKGLSAEEIRKNRQPELDKFNEVRKKYLIYQDFK